MTFPYGGAPYGASGEPVPERITPAPVEAMFDAVAPTVLLGMMVTPYPATAQFSAIAPTVSAPWSLVYHFEVDSERTGNYAAPIDDLTSFVRDDVAIQYGVQGYREVGAGIFSSFADPGEMTLWLDNSGGEFLPETLGAELLTNGGFSAWTGDNPDGWTVVGESGSDPEVSEVGATETHGGTGTGACNLFSSDADPVSITQSGLTVNARYLLTFKLLAQAAGAVRVYSGGAAVSPLYQETGVKTCYFTARGTDVELRGVYGCNVTVDDVSLRACARYAGALASGTLARLRVRYNGAAATLFEGKVSDLQIAAGEHSGQWARLVVRDPVWQLGEAEFDPKLLLNVTTDAALRAAFDDGVVVYPYDKSWWRVGVEGASEAGVTTTIFQNTLCNFEVGRGEIAFVGDNLDRKGGGVQARGYLEDVLAAEGGGRLWFDPPTRQFIFHNRHHDPLNDTLSATLDDSDAETAIVEGDYSDVIEVVNRVTLNYEPRSVGSPGSVLATLANTPVALPEKKRVEFTLHYADPTLPNARVGGRDFLPLTFQTDYDATYDSAGTDGIKKKHLVISYTHFADRLRVTLVNLYRRTIYLQKLQTRGTPLIVRGREMVVVDEPGSVYANDLRAVAVSAPTINDLEYAEEWSRQLAAKRRDPRPRFRSVAFAAALTGTLHGYAANVRIGDKVRVVASREAHDRIYAVVGMRHNLDAPNDFAHQATWVLTPSDPAQLWRVSDGAQFVDESQVGVSTRTGW